MPTIRKRGGRWQCQVRKAGSQPQSATFATKAAAQRWAAKLEAEIDNGRSRGRAATETFGELIERYTSGFDPNPRGKGITLRVLAQDLGTVKMRPGRRDDHPLGSEAA